MTTSSVTGIQGRREAGSCLRPSGSGAADATRRLSRRRWPPTGEARSHRPGGLGPPGPARAHGIEILYHASNMFPIEAPMTERAPTTRVPFAHGLALQGSINLRPWARKERTCSCSSARRRQGRRARRPQGAIARDRPQVQGHRAARTDHEGRRRHRAPRHALYYLYFGESRGGRSRRGRGSSRWVFLRGSRTDARLPGPVALVCERPDAVLDIPTAFVGRTTCSRGSPIASRRVRRLGGGGPVDRGYRPARCAVSTSDGQFVRDLVGAAGFEPTTTSPPDWCATRLRHAPTGVEV